MNLIPNRLSLAHAADYTACPELQAFIIEHADDHYLNVQTRLQELADQEADQDNTLEYRILPVAGEKRPSLRERLKYQLYACIP